MDLSYNCLSYDVNTQRNSQCKYVKITPADNNRLQQVRAGIDRLNFNIAKQETEKALNNSTDPLEQALALKEAGSFHRIATNVAYKYHVEGWVDDLELQAFESWYYIQAKNKYDLKTVFACTRSDVVKFVIREIFGTNEQSLQLHGLPIIEDIDECLNLAEQVIESRLLEVLEICNNPTEKTIAVLLAQGYKQVEIAEKLKYTKGYITQVTKSMAERV